MLIDFSYQLRIEAIIGEHDVCPSFSQKAPFIARGRSQVWRRRRILTTIHRRRHRRRQHRSLPLLCLLRLFHLCCSVCFSAHSIHSVASTPSLRGTKHSIFKRMFCFDVVAKEEEKRRSTTLVENEKKTRSPVFLSFSLNKLLLRRLAPQVLELQVNRVPDRPPFG